MSHCHNHTCNSGTSSVCQTLDELDFERGIWFAAQHGDIDRIQKLLSQGTNVDVRDNAGYTALHYAARGSHLQVCKLLISRRADINAITRSGQATALHRAATAGNFEIVKFLLAKGADVKMKDADGKTVLHRAAENQHGDIIEEILEVNRDLLNEKDNKGNIALNYIHNDDLKKLFIE